MKRVSELIGREVRDANGRRATLVDVVIDPLASPIGAESFGIDLIGALLG